MIPEKKWSESQNKWEKFGKKAKYAMFHGVTREPGNVLKEVETSERVGGYSSFKWQGWSNGGKNNNYYYNYNY